MSVLRICIFTETYHPIVGGGETQARSLAEDLVINGCEVIVITRRLSPFLKKVERFGRINVYRISPVGSSHFKKWVLPITSLPAFFKLRRKYDLIFVSGYRTVGISALLVSKLLGKACILKADSLGEMSGDFFAAGLAKIRLNTDSILFRVFLFLRNQILRHADRFVAISSAVAAELLSCGVKPEAIQTLPNYVDTDAFFPPNHDQKSRSRQKLNLPHDDKIVIYAGRLVSYKGLPLLLKVWKEIQKIRNNTQLLLLGSGGLDIHNCETELKKYTSSNNLTKCVHFIGDVNNVPEYLQASDIFVLPTENDAFPLALVEAMACGLAVISTPVGEIKTIVENMHNGLLVGVKNFQELYDALDTILSDESLSDRLGKNARQSIQNKYSAKMINQKYINLFRSLSGQ